MVWQLKTEDWAFILDQDESRPWFLKQIVMSVSCVAIFVWNQLVSCPRTLEMGRRRNSPEGHCFVLLCARTDLWVPCTTICNIPIWKILALSCGIVFRNIPSQCSACDQIRQIISLFRCDSCEKDIYFTLLHCHAHRKNTHKYSDDIKITWILWYVCALPCWLAQQSPKSWHKLNKGL